MTDLSHHLAQRYTRPDSCIMIRVDHSACLALGGTFDPCYILTLNTVPSQMGPSTNKRNAVLVQAFMAEILSVPAERGIVTFVPIPEENLAMNGNSMLGEMEKVERQQNGDSNVVKNAVKDVARKSMTFNKKSMPKLDGDAKTNGALTAAASGLSDKSATPPPLQAGSASENTKNERPSTAHGAFAAENGLRMNGISTDELSGKNSRTPNGRPKTFGGGEATSIQDQIKKEPMPLVSRQSYLKASDFQQRASRPEAKKSTTINTVPLAPRPVSVQQKPSTTSKMSSAQKAEVPKTRNTYLDNVSSLTSKNETSPLPKIVTSADDDDDDMPLAKTAAANTAKRRSTITATPKLPKMQPPPVPQDDTKSMSSRLGKRKSLLRIFKRSSVPTWYEH